MPRKYAKKSYPKRNGHGRPGYVRCGKMVISDASKALALAKYLKGIVNVEYKLIDTVTTLSAMTVAPVIIPLTNSVQGDTNITRDGSSLKIVSVSLNYFLTISSSATATVARVMLVHDRQTNQAIYNASFLIQDVTVGDNVNSPRNMDHARRFSVLYDKVHTLSSSGARVNHVRFFKPLLLKLRYDANDGTIADLTQSSLSLVFMSNEASNTSTITAFTRLRFVDN